MLDRRGGPLGLACTTRLKRIVADRTDRSDEAFRVQSVFEPALDWQTQSSALVRSIRYRPFSKSYRPSPSGRSVGCRRRLRDRSELLHEAQHIDADPVLDDLL